MDYLFLFFYLNGIVWFRLDTKSSVVADRLLHGEDPSWSFWDEVAALGMAVIFPLFLVLENLYVAYLYLTQVE